MNINFNNMFGNQQQPTGVNVPVDKLDLFIDRCVEEKGYSLQQLAQEIQQHLQSPGMHNIIHDSIYQNIIGRIVQRIQSGGK